MNIRRSEKIQNASKFLERINKCNTAEEMEELNDSIEEAMQAGYIFKKAYKFLSEEIDDHISYLVEKGIL